MGGHIAPAVESGKGAISPGMTTRLLMVCLGNICRSPTAEAAVRLAIARQGIDAVVESRGTAGWHVGRPADPRTVAHAARRGLDLSGHRARQLVAADLAAFDLILAMDRENLAAMTRLATSTQQAKLGLFLTGGAEVPDPWAGGPEGFEAVLDLCLERAEGLVTGLQGRPM
jgi:protein-tyrosine phosphatase